MVVYGVLIVGTLILRRRDRGRGGGARDGVGHIENLLNEVGMRFLRFAFN